jgi:hypothetical protein
VEDLIDGWRTVPFSELVRPEMTVRPMNLVFSRSLEDVNAYFRTSHIGWRTTFTGCGSQYRASLCGNCKPHLLNGVNVGCDHPDDSTGEGDVYAENLFVPPAAHSRKKLNVANIPDWVKFERSLLVTWASLILQRRGDCPYDECYRKRPRQLPAFRQMLQRKEREEYWRPDPTSGLWLGSENGQLREIVPKIVLISPEKLYLYREEDCERVQHL